MWLMIIVIFVNIVYMIKFMVVIGFREFGKCFIKEFCINENEWCYL